MSEEAGSGEAAMAANPPALLFDLVGALGDEVESNPGYRGISWALTK